MTNGSGYHSGTVCHILWIRLLNSLLIVYAKEMKILLLFQLVALLSYSLAFPETVIRFHKRPDARNMKYVQVNLNGQPVEMIFDTGASTISVTKEIYNSLGIPKIIGRYLSHTAGGDVYGYAFIIPSVRIGNIEVKNIVAHYDDVTTMNLLGGEVFKNFNYFINEKSQTITFTNDAGLLENKNTGLPDTGTITNDARNNSSLYFRVRDRLKE